MQEAGTFQGYLVKHGLIRPKLRCYRCLPFTLPPGFTSCDNEQLTIKACTLNTLVWDHVGFRNINSDIDGIVARDEESSAHKP